MSIPIVFVMNEDVNSFRYSLIYDHNYAEWFEEIQANGKNLPESEKKDLVAFIDQMIDQYCEGLPLMYKVLEVANSHDNEYHRIDRVVHSVSLFVLVTIIDILVASKFFLLATKDYERSFMRGKLKVILNEGFKKLYGFEKKTYEKSEWERILPILNHFPESINLQYQKLTELLEKHALFEHTIRTVFAIIRSCRHASARVQDRILKIPVLTASVIVGIGLVISANPMPFGRRRRPCLREREGPTGSDVYVADAWEG